MFDIRALVPEGWQTAEEGYKGEKRHRYSEYGNRARETHDGECLIPAN